MFQKYDMVRLTAGAIAVETHARQFRRKLEPGTIVQLINHWEHPVLGDIWTVRWNLPNGLTHYISNSWIEKAEKINE